MTEIPRERPSERPTLSPERFGLFLTHLGLTPNEAARLWNYDPRRVRRMKAGDEPVPQIVDVLLHNVTALQLLVDMLQTYFHDLPKPDWYGPRMMLAVSALELAIGRTEEIDGYRASDARDIGEGPSAPSHQDRTEPRREPDPEGKAE